MQFMQLPTVVYAEIDGEWLKCLGLSADGMVLLEGDKILHHRLVLRNNLMWPGGAR